MGEFLPVETEGENKIGSRYPGYRWIHSSFDDIGFEKEDGSGFEIIEVLGKPKPEVKDGQRILKQRIICVLKDEEASLYEMLQWDDPWRHHLAVGMAYLFRSAIAFFILIALQFVAMSFMVSAAGNSLFSGFIAVVSALIVCAVLSALEIALFWITKPWHFPKIIKTILFIRSLSRRSGRNIGYYADMLKVISREANCSDRASAAGKLLKFF